jgi:acyl dehydratase
MTRMGEQTRTLSAEDFAVPISDRYFEDYHPGAAYEYGYRSVTEDEVIGFAQRYDPQPIHVDAAYANAGPFGGIIASGWHSAALLMRILADHYLSRVASLASPGIDELRWSTPLRPGDLIRARAMIIEARPSKSSDDRGMVITRAQLLNQDDRSRSAFWL